MRKFATWQKVGLGIFGFLSFSYLGLMILPAWWWVFSFMPFVGYGVWHVSRRGWKFWKSKRKFERGHEKTITPIEAKQRILDYCNEKDYRIVPTSPKDGGYETEKEAGARKIPYYVLITKMSASKLERCMAVFWCNMISGSVGGRDIEGISFTEADLDDFLESCAGRKEWVERRIEPKVEGTIVERVVKEYPKEGG